MCIKICRMGVQNVWEDNQARTLWVQSASVGMQISWKSDENTTTVSNRQTMGINWMIAGNWQWKHHLMIVTWLWSIPVSILNHLIGSHITSHWGTLTATDREVIVFTLLLLIDHFRYFVCRGLDVVTLPKFPLAFYGQTDPSFIPCLDDVPCQITFCW